MVERLAALRKQKPSTPVPPSSAAGVATDADGMLSAAFPPSHIRNVSVVAHVDHGKTTLTDAILRWAGLLSKDSTVGTFTDRLQVEKERGITIKAQTCSVLVWLRPDEDNGSGPVDATDVSSLYLINLVDTPGHADFQYEVSRSLRASEGALLLVDATQGVEAQTLAQFHAVLEQEAELVPVLTKMDAANSDDRVLKTLVEMEDTMGMLRDEVLMTSAKQMKGVEAIFRAIVDRVPPPQGRAGFSDLSQLPLLLPDSDQRRATEASLVPLRALIFDCWTLESGGMRAAGGAASTGQSGATEKQHQQPSGSGGVYALVRVIDGTLTVGAKVVLHHSRQRPTVEEVGFIHPDLHVLPALTAGMVGYVLLSGVTPGEVRVGDSLCTLPTPRHTLSAAANSTSEEWVVKAVPGFQKMHPVVFAGIFPDDNHLITALYDVVDLLCLNDPAVTVEKTKCQALGAGLQLGFLGLLHLNVFTERLLQEFGMPVLVTPPQVQYMYVGSNEDISNPLHHKPITVENWRWPHEGVAAYLEPVVLATVITPGAHFDAINQAALTQYRGEQVEMKGMDDGRMAVRYRMPLCDLARGFLSTVKSLSHGYASLDYDRPQYVEAAVVKVDIIINKARVSALSFIAPQHEAVNRARQVLASLKANLQRCSVDLPIQAVMGTKIVARETVKAYRKDVTAKIHAGDISRKQKKWSDQKKGKKRMARRIVGGVTLDQEVLSAAMGATRVS